MPVLNQTAAVADPAPGTKSPRGQSGADNTSISCALCGKAYSRISHLARHHRSHTQQKLFSCDTCGRDFTRADVLKRHTELHAEGQRKKRKQLGGQPHWRVAKACNQCAVKKLKCDAEKPCGRCRQRGIECTVSRGSPAAPPAQASVDQERPMCFPTTGPFTRSDISQTGLPSPDQSQGIYIQADCEPNQVQGSPSVVDLTATNVGTLPNIAPSDTLATIDHQSMLSVLDDSSLANFLNDFIMPISPDTPADYERFMSACSSWHAQSSRDLLDFGVEPTPCTGPGYSLTENMRRAKNRKEDHPILSSGTTTPINPDIVGLRTDIFQHSFWRWDPTMFDNCGAERVNISIQVGPADCPETYMATKCQMWSQNISSTLRDKILVLVLSTLGPNVTQTVLSSFPTLGLLNSLMHHFLNGHAASIASWLHLPTFDAEKVRIQLLLMIIAAGAITCTHPMIQQLGFALQEVVRDLLQREFEGDNRYTRDLQFLQAFSLVLEAGLWSGHKRKMEIAEGFMLPIITMMRRGGYFTRFAAHTNAPSADDDPETLETKWRDWIQAECFKRLAFRLMIHDAQCSMALQTTPLFSYGEISLDLPAAREIWMAANAHEWRTQYLRHYTGPADSSPTTHYVHEISRLRTKRGIDLDLSAFVVVYTTWSLVWSQLQLQSMLEYQPSNPQHCYPATSSSYHQELRQVLGQIHMSLVDWDARSRLKLDLLVQRIMLSLHVSFDLVQTFAGKNGAEAARQSFPLQQRWIESSRSREAIWHAGQILRLAGQSVRGGEQVVHFDSICVYHAGLTFWAYSTVQFIEQKRSQAVKKSSKLQEMRPPSEELVWLDSEYANNIQQFISLGRGTPVVCDWRKGEPTMSNPIYLNDSNAVLRLCISILRYRVEGGIDERPLSLVDNLCQMMQDLGRASKGLNGN